MKEVIVKSRNCWNMSPAALALVIVDYDGTIIHWLSVDTNELKIDTRVLHIRALTKYPLQAVDEFPSRHPWQLSSVPVALQSYQNP